MVSTKEEFTGHFLDKFCQSRNLNGVFRRNAETYFFDYAARLSERAHSMGRPFIVGLNGAQGSGKSTLSEFLEALLPQFFDVDCHVLSIDDFYLSKAQRRKLGAVIHPLLATRGVPGTHDCARLSDVLAECKQGASGEIAIPIFDKLKDDRTRKVRKIQMSANPTVIVLEGWCVGVPAQSSLDLVVPVSSFEFSEDNLGVWRAYVNEQLATVYAGIFREVEHLSMLKPPCFEAVLDWRVDQEVRLIAKRRSQLADDDVRGMNVKQVAEFVEHFRRLTCHAMEVLPDLAHQTWELQADRLILGEVTQK